MVSTQDVLFFLVRTFYVILFSTGCVQNKKSFPLSSSNTIDESEESWIKQMFSNLGRKNFFQPSDVRLLDPLRVGSILTSFEEGNLLFHFDAKDVIVERLSAYQVLGVNKRMDERAMTVRFHFPYLKVRGNFKLDGKSSSYDAIAGGGEMKLALHYMITEANCRINDVNDVNGTKTIAIEGPCFNTTYAAIAAQFSNLIGNSDFITNTKPFSVFLGRRIFESLQAVIEQEFSDHLSTLLNRSYRI